MKNPGIYILTSPSGKQYVGKDRNLPRRPKEHFSGNAPNCRAIHDAIKKYGADAFSVEIIQYPGISDEALNAVEIWKIRQLQTLTPKGYNLTEGGEGVKPSEETRNKMSEANLQRVADGTHTLLGGGLQRRTNKKRIADGTHHLLGPNNPVHKRVADGTHHFFDGELQRHNARKRLEDGTHNFLDSEFQRHTNKKRIEDGTHHFLGESHPIRRLAKEGKHPKTRKRQKAEWCYIIALSRFWYEIHEYTLKRRAEFLSKDIPDTSNAEQEYLF